MPRRVAIIGVGNTRLRRISPKVSFRETVFEAAVKAYACAGKIYGPGVELVIRKHR